MTGTAAREMWRRHLQRVAAAGRAFRKAQVGAALADYDRSRDLAVLLRRPCAPAMTAREAALALRAEAHRQTRLRRAGGPSLRPAGMALLLAALIAERRG
jgi:hypothetical protein